MRQALRRLRRDRRYALIIIVLLTIGTSATSVVSGLVDSVFLRSLPYHKPDELVSVRLTERSSGVGVPASTVAAWRSSPALTGLAGSSTGTRVLVTDDGRQYELAAAWASPQLFDVLGVQAVERGRPLADQDSLPGAERVVLVGHRVGSEFLDEPEPLNRSIRLSGRSYRVVGVMATDFRYPAPIQPDIVLPMVGVPAGGTVSVGFIGRLSAATDLAGVERELAAVWRRDAEVPPGLREALVRVDGLRSHLVSDARPTVVLLVSCALLLLLATCGNVVFVTLARVEAKRSDVAVRIALGASRWRSVAPYVLDVSLLVAVSAACAMAIAHLIAPVLPRFTSQFAAPGLTALDSRLLLASLLVGVAAVAAVSFGLLRRRITTSPVETMNAHAVPRGMSGGRQTMVAIEVGAATACLVVLLLVVTSVARLTDSRLGFEVDNLLTFKFTTPAPAATRSETLYRLKNGLSAVPGVLSVSATTTLPLGGQGYGFAITQEGLEHTRDAEMTAVDLILPDFFRTFGARLLAGRDVSAADLAHAAPVALVNEAYLRSTSQDVNTLGRRLSLGGGAGVVPTITIVGVVSDILGGAPAEPAEPRVYRPFAQAAPQMGWHTASFIVKTSGQDVSVGEILSLARRLDPDGAVYDVRTMSGRLNDTIVPERQRVVVLGISALLAAVIAVGGLYGLMLMTVAAEARDIAIRRMLGASLATVVQGVLTRAAVATVAGLAIGLVGARLIAHLTGSWLFGIEAGHWPSYVVAAAGMSLAAALGVAGPLVRVCSIEPAALIRH